VAVYGHSFIQAIKTTKIWFGTVKFYEELISIFLPRVIWRCGLSAYMPTFPIYAGFSRFEVVEKMNPDIPIGIAKLLRNPDFLKISPLSRRITPNFIFRATFYSRQPIGNQESSPPLLVYMCSVL
jgi:hypothetical protein